jgi:hypothetical protein
MTFNGKRDLPQRHNPPRGREARGHKVKTGLFNWKGAEKRRGLAWNNSKQINFSNDERK